MINDIDFVISPHATKRLERIVEIGFGQFDIQMVDESNTTQTFRVDYSTLPIGAAVETDLPDPIRVIISRAGKDDTHRIKISFFYYYDETQPPPEDNIGVLGSFRYVTPSGVQYPTYVLWPNSVTQEALTFDNTLVPSQIASITTITDDAKSKNITNWKTRLNFIALMFDNKDVSFKWAHQDANNSNISTPLAVGSDSAKKLDNTGKHYPKGIGIAWRAVCAYEDPSYTVYGVPNLIRTDGSDPMTATPINVVDGTGLETLVKQIENEYNFRDYDDELLINSVRNWYFMTGQTNNLILWSGYYANTTWYFTNYSGAQKGEGLYSLYSAMNPQDWNDLWGQYVNALNWQSS